jgi:hypothetical protein
MKSDNLSERIGRRVDTPQRRDRSRSRDQDIRRCPRYVPATVTAPAAAPAAAAPALAPLSLSLSLSLLLPESCSSSIESCSPVLRKNRNNCICCGVDMGDSNARQYCGKYVCDNEWLLGI